MKILQQRRTEINGVQRCFLVNTFKTDTRVALYEIFVWLFTGSLFFDKPDSTFKQR